jgi:SHS2 domain-containing protein
MADPSSIQPREERFLQASGYDDAAQVVNWLNEIIFFFDTEGLVLTQFVIDSWTNSVITGRASGERFDRNRHTLRTAIKAATYHQFESVPKGCHWEIRVFLDI